MFDVSRHHSKFMKWFKITVDRKAVANGVLNQVSDAFERIMPPGDESNDCTLFLTDLAGASAIFISPHFAAIGPQLLDAFLAVECEAPPPRTPDTEFGTFLLLGSHQNFAWSLLC